MPPSRRRRHTRREGDHYSAKVGNGIASMNRRRFSFRRKRSKFTQNRVAGAIERPRSAPPRPASRTLESSLCVRVLTTRPLQIQHVVVRVIGDRCGGNQLPPIRPHLIQVFRDLLSCSACRVRGLSNETAGFEDYRLVFPSLHRSSHVLYDPIEKSNYRRSSSTELRKHCRTRYFASRFCISGSLTTARISSSTLMSPPGSFHYHLGEAGFKAKLVTVGDVAGTRFQTLSATRVGA